jgi:transposase
VYLEADALRVACPEHGVVVTAVPWARHGSRFTTAFEDTTAWLAAHAALTVLAMLLRISWRSVAAIVVRVVAEAAGKRDRLAGLRRIGIDEISYRKGQRYLLCVVDHDTGRLVWAGTNRTAATLREFFPDTLSSDQKTTLAVIAKINGPLYRAYLLKEQLREVFAAKGAHGRALLAGWLSWARRCRIPEFVKLAKTITRFLPLIHNALDHGLSNALSEATNTHIRLLTRRAYGYHSPDALIAMATLTRGGLCPPLPGRS